MILGHSAGVAAVMALRSGKPVQQVDPASLGRKLRAQAQILERPGGGK